MYFRSFIFSSIHQIRLRAIYYSGPVLPYPFFQRWLSILFFPLKGNTLRTPLRMRLPHAWAMSTVTRVTSFLIKCLSPDQLQSRTTGVFFSYQEDLHLICRGFLQIKLQVIIRYSRVAEPTTVPTHKNFYVFTNFNSNVLYHYIWTKCYGFIQAEITRRTRTRWPQW